MCVELEKSAMANSYWSGTREKSMMILKLSSHVAQLRLMSMLGLCHDVYATWPERVCTKLRIVYVYAKYKESRNHRTPNRQNSKYLLDTLEILLKP